HVPPHEVVYASAQPLDIGTWWHAGECRAVELARRGLGKCRCGLLRPFDAAAARDHLMESQHFARQSALARSRQEIGHPRPVRAMGVAERAGEQQRPFAFPKIAVDLLAVSRNVTFEVQNVVSDLKRESEQVPKSVETAEIPILAIGNQRADSHWVNE